MSRWRVCAIHLTEWGRVRRRNSGGAPVVHESIVWPPEHAAHIERMLTAQVEVGEVSNVECEVQLRQHSGDALQIGCSSSSKARMAQGGSLGDAA